MIDKQKIEDVVLKSFSDVTGLDVSSVQKIRGENILEKGIVNSLVLVSLINSIDDMLDVDIDFKIFQLEDFRSIDTIINKLAKEYK